MSSFRYTNAFHVLYSMRFVQATNEKPIANNNKTPKIIVFAMRERTIACGVCVCVCVLKRAHIVDRLDDNMLFA